MKTHLISGALAAAMLAMTGCASDGDAAATTSASASTADKDSGKSKRAKRGAPFTSETFTATGGGDVLGSVKRALAARGWQTLNDGGNTIDARQVGRKQTSDIRVTVNGNSFTIAYLGGEQGGGLTGWAKNVAFDALVFSGMDRVTATEATGRRGRRR